MTRDDVLLAVSNALGARAEAVVGFWNVHVHTCPPREVVFTADWVLRHVGDEPGSREDLEQMLRNARDDEWLSDPKSGYLIYLVR